MGKTNIYYSFICSFIYLNIRIPFFPLPTGICQVPLPEGRNSSLYQIYKGEQNKQDLTLIFKGHEMKSEKINGLEKMVR